MKKFYCPCCGYDTFDTKPSGTYSICDICFWEDDLTQTENPSYGGGANSVSLIQAQMNFEEYGAIEHNLIKRTRKPEINDIRNPNWRIF